MSIVNGQTASATDILAMVNASITTGAGDGLTKSLTTVAGETVLVIAKGTAIRTGGELTLNVYLTYNGVQKDICRCTVATAQFDNFTLMYTETPGAATHNIVVSSDSGLATENLSILVLKLNTKS